MSTEEARFSIWDDLQRASMRRANLVEALHMLDSIRPMLDNKDGEVWATVWKAAYSEAIEAAKAWLDAKRQPPASTV